MGRFDRLKAKTKKVEIGGEEFVLKPLKFKHLDAFMKTADESKRTEAIKEIITLTMKESYPDEEFDIDEISMEFLEELTKAIFSVNGINIGEK